MSATSPAASSSATPNPLDGPPPDLHADAIIIAAAIGWALSFMFLALRLYVRTIMTKFYGYDDWAIVIAFINFTVLTGIQITYGVIVRGYGIDTELDRASLILGWHTFFYAIDQAFLKVALAAFYMRVLQKGSWQFKVVIVTTTIFVLFTIAFSFILLFQCGNPDNVLSTNCLPENPLTVLIYMQASLNALQDWILTLLPVTVIFNTQMSKKIKISVISIMMLGIGASIISIVRIPYLGMSSVSGVQSYIDITILVILSFWENAIGQIAISMAALRPLMQRITKGTGFSATEYTGDKTNTRRTGNPMTMQSQIAVKQTYEVQTDENFDEVELINRSAPKDGESPA